MPTPMLKKLAEENDMAVSAIEALWEQAKKTAEEEGEKDNYSYITTIVQKLVQGKKKEVKKEDTQKVNVQPSRVSKANAKKHILYGVVLSAYGPDGVFVDSQNDWTSPADIEKSAHAYMQSSRTIRRQHLENVQASVVESFVEPYPTHEDYCKAMNNEDHVVSCRTFGTDTVRSGDWVIGVHVGPEEWKAYEAGEITAFSPRGMGERMVVEPSSFPKISFVEA